MRSQLRQEPRLANDGLVGQRQCELRLVGKSADDKLFGIISACRRFQRIRFYVFTLFALLNFLLKPPYLGTRMKKNTMTLMAAGVCAAVVAQVANAAPVSLYSQNFDSMTTSSTASLPTDWLFAGASPTYTGTTTAETTKSAGTSGTGVVSGTSSGGAYEWVNGVLASGTDKAIGFLTSGSYSSPRSILFKWTNSTGYNRTTTDVAWDYEKYRSGSRQFDWTFFSSTDGTTWNSVALGNQSYSADANNTTVSSPPTTISKSVTVTESVNNGSSLYLRWTYTGLLGSTNAQGLGVDNFTIVPAPGAVAFICLAGLVARRRRN